ncbi:class I SAM-dependent methyltransferase [Rhodococcus sp. (in: high G+C Gram-positive bacteria)]|uniref:class I SAM-dependent methyltransferase n=1 Tax=Rhodococcus sp. TaxID=1831 RepID=UPI00257CED14|nr:class I SAM-dependent methyltransferase [Rhodococcus sp. (in: high G+C Gram-positive bacteria)]MBQ9053025.1 class I SAM-dependent methyltransferase [Rhodococcus sp. (in: high G+C Gram-positive bacteria)]
MGVVDRLNSFNEAHPWSHNDFHIPWIMRQLAGAPHSSALDVGCGTGNLLDRLAQRFDSVTGVEPDPATEQIVAARFSSHAAVEIRCSTLAEVGLGERFDAITLVAVLHHLPLEETLGRLRGMLSAGGCLVIVGCYREDTIVDRVFSLVALVLNPIVGFVKHRKVADKLPAGMTAPTAAPTETLDEIKRAAQEQLPGCRIRRHLFWRYSVVFTET